MGSATPSAPLTLRLASHRRARREARVADALARIPAEHLSGVGWEAVSARVAAFGLVPGQAYGRFGQPAAFDSSTPFIGEIALGGWTFAPVGYLLCNGALLNISEYDVLFALIGTTYGGDGQTTFGLPDLRGRSPRGTGQGPSLSPVVLGTKQGTETVTLTASQMSAHQHTQSVTTAPGTTATPSSSDVPAAVDGAMQPRYAPTATADVMGATTAAGGGQPVPNRSPVLALTMCIAESGIFPSRP